MDRGKQPISLDDEEEEGISVDITLEDGTNDYKWCFVGMFLTYNKIHFGTMQSVMAEIWHPLDGVSISDLGAKRCLFRFFNDVDFDRVKDGEPWFF